MLPLNPSRLSEADLPGATAAKVWVVRNRDCMDDPRTVAFDVGQLIRQGVLGEVYYLYSVRVNLGIIRQRENALESLDARVGRYRTASKEIKESTIDDIRAELETIARITAESTRRIRGQSGSRAAALEL